MSDTGPPPTAESATATLEQARAHARGQAAAAVEGTATGVTRPTSAARDLPPDIRAESVIWDETIAVGGYAARRLPLGARLRVADLTGDACAQVLVHNARHTAERLNVADTVKVQWQAYLSEGALLLSDMGRVLMTIVADTSARHDCFSGATTAVRNERRYGDGRASGPAPSGRDLLALGALKHGLERVDVGPCINLFKGVRIDDDGTMIFDGVASAPSHVELQAEMDVVIVVANTPHVLDDRADYTGSPVRLTAWRPAVADDRSRRSTPERARAFLNTDDYLLEVAP